MKLFIQKIFVVILSIFGFIQIANSQQLDKPNIVLILTDDQGWWELGANGNDILEAPILDELAKESINFTHYYAAPVCSPTRAGIMTGRYHLRTGLYNTRFGGDVIDTSEITIAEILENCGYRTGLFGKWHLGKYYGYQPGQRGFQEFFGHYSGHIEEYDYPDQLVYNGSSVEGRKYTTDLFTDAAINFISEESDDPFFCYLAYNAPHSPWVVGTSHGRQTRGDKLIKKYIDKGLSMKDARIYSMIEIIDENLGRLFEKLEELGKSENTIVIFSGDNGGVSSYFTGGLRGKKGTVYEGGVRSPFLFKWPGQVEKGKNVDAMISHIDILPTLCEIVNTNVPNDRIIDGKSLVPLLKGKTDRSPHKYLFHHWDRYYPNPYNTWAVSDGRFKLLNSPRPWPETAIVQPEPFGELYDLKLDPSETNDIAKMHPEKVKSLRLAFLDYYESVTENRIYKPISIPVGNEQENPVEIQSSWAKLIGDNINYTFLGYDWDSIDSWKYSNEFATWDLDVVNSGVFEIFMSYAVPNYNEGASITISTDKSNEIEYYPESTPSEDVFIRRKIGEIELDKGSRILKVQIKSATGKEAMKLNRIWLKKI